MNGDYIRNLDDCMLELNKIADWINQNIFHTNIRYLVSYSVVRACATIEVVFKNIIFDYLAQNVSENTKCYLSKMIVESSCNPGPGNISNLLQQINSVWKNDFDSRLKNTNQKADLSSLVNLRNDFAHGRDVTASINTIKRYFESGVWVLNVLDSILISAVE